MTLIMSSYSQEKTKDKLFSVGLGFGNENNVSNYGIFFTNDLKIGLTDKLYINPRLSFFQSLGSIENADDYGYRSHSGLFIDLGLGYSIIKKQKFDISINLGPSTEIGSETYSSMQRYENGILVEEQFENNNLKQFGFYSDIEIIWITGNLTNTIGLKTNYFGIYPEFIGIVYKIGLRI